MTARRTMTTQERRARLAVRHRLAPAAKVDDDVVAIARSVVALHATDPLTVVLSTLVRMRTPDQAAIEAALYEDRTVVRALAMRRTLWGVPVPDLAMVQAAAGDRVAADERRRLAKDLEAAGVTDDGHTWIDAAGADLVAALRAHGPTAAADLPALVPALGTRLTIAPGKPYEATVSVASRLLTVLSAEGRVVRGRPRGAWTGTQHHWTTPERWLGDRAPAPMDPDAARTALAEAWLARFGPATVADLAWWAKWPLGITRATLAAVDTEEVDVDGVPHLVLAGDTEPTPEPEPWVALLPSLDPTIMGWKERSWYLGDLGPALFDTVGNAGPTIWVDGRAVGAWGQRKDGEIVVEVLEDVGRERRAAIDRAAEDLAGMLGDLRVSFRFTSALGKRLVD